MNEVDNGVCCLKDALRGLPANWTMVTNVVFAQPGNLKSAKGTCVWSNFWGYLVKNVFTHQNGRHPNTQTQQCRSGPNEARLGKLITGLVCIFRNVLQLAKKIKRVDYAFAPRRYAVSDVRLRSSKILKNINISIFICVPQCVGAFVGWEIKKNTQTRIFLLLKTRAITTSMGLNQCWEIGRR